MDAVLKPEDAEVIEILFGPARDVQRRSYSPYSGYRVGAALLTDQGNVYACCNVENAAFPVSTCAEQGAISQMIAGGEHRIVAVLTVCDGEPLGTCCGGCRQRIREFAGPDTPIFAADEHGVRMRFTMSELLPHSFGPEHLAVEPDEGSP